MGGRGSTGGNNPGSNKEDILSMSAQMKAARQREAAQKRNENLKKAENKTSNKADYHVDHRDSAGGEYIDKGTIAGRTIGSSVKLDYGGETRTGKIVGAHKYPNGRIEFTVKMKATKTAIAITKTVSDKRFKK